MNAVDRAAEVIQAQIDRDLHALNGQQGIAFAEWFGERCADRLAAENLLVTDEIERVVAAARRWVKADMLTSTYLDYLERCNAHFELRQAIRALVRALDHGLSDVIRDELDPNRP